MAHNRIYIRGYFLKYFKKNFKLYNYMKTITKILTAVLFISNVCFPLREASSNGLNYKLTISNLNYTSETSLQFDVYLLNTSNEEFRYSIGQYFLEFNPKIANGGTLTYSIIESALPELMRPRNASVSGDQLRLAMNTISSSKENLPLIPSKEPGILIVRMKLETSAKTFADVPLNLKLSSAIFKTKIFAYLDNKTIEITNSENNVADLLEKNGAVTQNNTELPKEYALSQNYPNPFNPETKIEFDIPNLSNVKLIIYDITGRAVTTLVNQELQPGRYEFKFDGNNFASGIYFYKIGAGDFSAVKKMFLIK